MLKFFPKILIIFFLIIFIFQLACLLFLTLAPSVSQAADPATFKPQVQIPGMDQADAFGAPDSKGAYAIPGSTASIAKYIRVIYKYAIGIVGILAAVVLMIGGVMWIVAGGSATRIGEAKAWIGASLTGLLLALMSYLILATVNPALVDFKTTPVTPVTPLESIVTTQGCCVPVNKNSIIQKCATGKINDEGKDLCLKPDYKYNSSPCNQIKECKEQYLTDCDGTNNGAWCGDKTTQACKNGNCDKCAIKDEDCGTIDGAIFGEAAIVCCPGLKCNTTLDLDLSGDCVPN